MLLFLCDKPLPASASNLSELLTKGGVVCQQSSLRALVVGSKVEQRVADARGNVGAAFASARHNVGYVVAAQNVKKSPSLFNIPKRVAKGCLKGGIVTKGALSPQRA